MASDSRLCDALRDLARGAAGTRTLIRHLTTRQASTAAPTALPTSPVALTPGPALPGARYLMVGKDTLDNEQVVLG